MKKALITFGIFVSLLVVHAGSLFAQPDARRTLIPDCIHYLSTINSGSVRYTITENSMSDSKLRRDTVIFSFDKLEDSSEQIFVLDRGSFLFLYDGKDFYKLNRNRQSYTKDPMSAPAAWDKTSSNMPGPLANRGEALRRYAKDPDAIISARDSVVLESECNVIEITKNSKTKGDQARHVQYYVAPDHSIEGYRYEVTESGRSTTQEVHVLHASYNKSNREELEKFIEMTKQLLLKFREDSSERHQASAADALLPKGAMAPDFAGVSVEGDTIDLYAEHGKVILLDFWFASCMPCRNFTPFLKLLKEKYSSKGLVILGLDPIDHSESTIKDASKAMTTNFPEMMVPSDVASDYGVSVYPTAYLLDHDKRVIHVQMGYSSSRIEELEKAIQQALQ